MTQLIDIGYRTGLFKASKGEPASSEELSERAGLHERYVREWLGAVWGEQTAKRMLAEAGFSRV